MTRCARKPATKWANPIAPCWAISGMKAAIISGTGWSPPIRKRWKPICAIFGDERADYDAALKEHYENGAPPNWQENFVSVLCHHPSLEDFAETWAHYLHIVDTLETAAAFGVKVKPRVANGELAARVDFDPHNVTDHGSS